MRYLTTLLVCTSVVVYTLYSLIIAFDIPFDDFPITKQEVGAEMRTKAAKYEPSLAPMERKLVKELSTILAPLNEGTQKVLELDAAKQRLAEQRQERDTAAKKALERVKNQTNYRSGRLGGRSSSSASSGKPLGNKSSYGGGYDAYAPFPGSYGGFSDYHTGYGDYGSTHPAPLSSRTAKADEQSPTNSLLTNTKNEST
ncbi:hypothetical protein EBZ39_13815, partial [bacterium]|nr:hypothetical protein [bacterium]